MGGIGKTTLAKQVYDRVVTQFDCHAWITVSESYDKKELLRTLMENFGIEMETDIPARNGGVDEEIKMVTTIRKYLRDKRYVVIFDDVWKIEFWSDIEHALLDNNKGGRVLITTRSLDVAKFCKISSYVHVHKLQPLPSEKAWPLFCNRAFHFQFGGSCPPELENYSVTMISLLPQKLLLGLYPEDYSINCSRLIRQWVSEGFITSKKDKTLEEVAQQYLTELMNRSLVQVSKVSYRGKPKECRIHDLLRDMILRKMEDLRFGSHYFPSDGSSFSELARRLTIHSRPLIHISNEKYCRVRGVLTFTSNLHNMTFCSKFKLLKVLDFEGATHFNHLPEGMGDLFHLKYLSVAHKIVEKLPSSIGKLQNLETLNLKGSGVDMIESHQISRLHKLRHLVFTRGFREDVVLGLFKGFGSFALQKLYDVRISDNIEELKKLTQLRKLGITVRTTR
ncbi:hypothetical protein FNV43_RR01316 [Rhamnella rubrinervis]|uniref:NB-ARC domain-containing protein n=1 Tax=Rhamnella rubrinervis TaxID=2594499 RepID=A0A8K0HPD9_9ROSA|nr:hypothetical protein FNV43_RR01316 [Rhamnella rubrinervis]